MSESTQFYEAIIESLRATNVTLKSQNEMIKSLTESVKILSDRVNVLENFVNDELSRYGEECISSIINNKVKIMSDGGEEFVPQSKQGDSGYDLKAYIDEDIVLASGERKLVSTGIKLEMPSEYEAQVRPRSGLAIKNGITVLNTPGTVDENYRGIVGVILQNTSKEEFVIHRGDRIAQLVFMKIRKPSIDIVSELSDTNRGAGGFGSTGI